MNAAVLKVVNFPAKIATAVPRQHIFVQKIGDNPQNKASIKNPIT
jgi:hypothetical protein